MEWNFFSPESLLSSHDELVGGIIFAGAAVVVVSEPTRVLERAVCPSVPLEPDWCRFAGSMLRALRPLVPPSSS